MSRHNLSPDGSVDRRGGAVATEDLPVEWDREGITAAAWPGPGCAAFRMDGGERWARR